MSIQSQLISDWYRMSETAELLFKNCLVSDPIKEVIDTLGTFKKTADFINNQDLLVKDGKMKENDHVLKKHRKTVASWLSSICWDIDNVSDRWLWEMDYRIRKVLVIMIALERRNLMSFSGFEGVPKPEDCPQYIPVIWNTLEKKKETFENMKKTYRSLISDHEVLSYYCSKKVLSYYCSKK